MMNIVEEKNAVEEVVLEKKDIILEKSKVFPQELKDRRIWCNWEWRYRADGTRFKFPMVSSVGGGAKANDPDTWSDFDLAISKVTDGRGIGLFIDEPYVGVDIDDVEDELNRHLEGDFEDNIASEFIHNLDSYTERSPSGTGFHTFVIGDLPEHDRQNGNVEMYKDGRFFTVTFDSIGPDYLRDDSVTDEVGKLHTKYVKRDRVEYKPEYTPTGEQVTNDLTDEQVIERAKDSAQSDRFTRLLNGSYESIVSPDGDDVYPSQSEADLGFANMLAFWTGKDKDQMDRIFRDSGLMRPKWDEYRGNESYGEIVINTAVSGTKEIYTPRTNTSMVYGMDGDSTTFKDTWKINQDEPTLEDLSSFPLRSADDTGNAERLIDRYGDIMRYDFGKGKFYVYNGQVWAIDNIGQARRLVNHTVDSIEDEDWSTGKDKEVKKNSADDVWVDDEDEGKKDKANEAKMKHVTRSRSRASKTNMLELAQTYVPVEDGDFDKEDHLFNTENGYVDLRTGELMRSDKDQMFSMLANTKVNKAAKPTRWLKFLDDVFDGDQEIIDFVQRAVGYTLSGRIGEQAMFILFGNGNNGKTVFVETIRDIVGTYTKNIGASSLGTKPSTANTNDLAKLSGVRMVTSSEPNNGFRFDEGLIKEVTGDEVMTARFLFKEEFDYVPKFKLWLTTNYKPIIVGTDDGIWRRLKIIPFNVKIKEEDVDRDIKDKLLEESEGILNWAIEGAVEWFANGLQTPDSIKAETDDYRKQMNILEAFIGDECQTGEGLEVRASELWERYKYWSDNNRYDSINRNEFGERMSKAYDRKRKSSGYHYIGLELV